MLKETYLAIKKNVPKDAIPIVVTRTAGSILSPSWILLNDYKEQRITWEQYKERFHNEMDNEPCRAYMKKIKLLAKERDVYLICYEKPPKPCHCFLLLEMINNMEE